MPTHGALSKAGKVRSLSGANKSGLKSRPNPKVNTRRKYRNRVVLQRGVGQYRPGRRRYRRRRRR